MVGRARIPCYMAGGVVDEELTAILEEALSRLPAADSPLRARLLARLADELSFSSRRDVSAKLSEQAVATARRVDDPRAYSFALTSRHWCLWGPENLQDRLAAAQELLALGERTGQKAIVVEGHRWSPFPHFTRVVSVPSPPIWARVEGGQALLV